jgi:3-phenylpropionate/trans-cinnamate dioxygenase ferredoxin subunit
MARHAVCFADELAPGERRIVDLEGRSIGVFNVNGDFHAVRNRCPHKGAPLCLGLAKGLVVGSQPYEYEIVRDGEILRCPWHGWEFDLLTGKSIFNPHRLRVKSYAVSVEDWPYDYAEPGENTDEDPALETFDVSLEPGDVPGRSVVMVHVS